MNYAQKELRKTTQRLDATVVKIEDWAFLADQKGALTLTLAFNGRSLSIDLTGDSLEEVLHVVDSALVKEAAGLKSEEVRWCREIVLLDEQARQAEAFRGANCGLPNSAA